MSVFHRVDDIWSMPAAKFFAFAWRLPHYRGVMRERVLAEQRDSSSRRPQQQRPATRQASPARQAPPPATPAVVRSDPVLGGVFSFSSFSSPSTDDAPGADDARADLRETAQQEYPELH
jgi:hypothetical protein